MVATVFLIIILAAVVIAIVGAATTGKGEFKAAAGIGIVIFVVTLIFSCATIVGTRQVGIVTQWNRPTGQTFSNGLHFVLPWTQVHEMDAAIQNSVYKGDDRILVRLGNSSTALADANIRWQIKESEADDLFVNYKDFDGVKSNLIDRNLRVALNDAFALYDPLEPKNLEESKLPGLANKAKEILQAKVGNQVEIIDVSVPTIDFDDNTENRINQINAARAQTAQAEQEVKTAEQNKKANEILASQAPPNLNIAIANCLNKSVEKGINPAGCWPIGNGVVPTLAVPR